ncbi:hypothetical protein Dform_00308 [Dehalogenimonas formicexedens]|uniref:Uncharacterized protein n=1 Tax=Dehalogenimonas formicexedens TaxID=1839801 RepID=A0A1P8F5G1_9CHLR|nr:hypothetical protein [Dehalogenimonas formicexedens]APV43668.1 hypothetical protein Dform_00308 [Dehalogenimonas formicexedens]
MFDKEYSFRGSHADKVIKLTAGFGKDNFKLFARNLDVYLVAPIVGFLYGSTAELDKSDSTTKIFPEQLLKAYQDLMFQYRLILLLDKSYEGKLDERIDKAFRHYGSERALQDEQLYERYVLGGVDILYEKLIATANNEDDYLKNLYDFIEEFDDRYNKLVSTDNILDLCRLARS